MNNFMDNNKLNMLKINNISYTYSKFEFIKNFNLVIDYNKITCLIGENGAGKSTLIKLISGLIKPQKGSVEIFGMNYKENNEFLRSNVFVTVNSPKFYEHLSVQDNLKIYCNIKNIEFDSCLKYLDRYEIKKEKHIKELSSGMKQKLSLIYMFIKKYKLVVLDEPITNIDPKGINLLIDDIYEMYTREPINIIISTHLLNEFSNIFDSFIIIKEGKLVHQEDIERGQIFQNYQNKIIKYL